jgi:DNA modification methylase
MIDSRELDYDSFIKSKWVTHEESGFKIESDKISSILFDFQRDIVIWALKKGKACIFAGTGTGKTLMQLEWAKQVHAHTKGDILILAPLAVTYQTREEGLKLDMDVHVCRSQADVKPGINITNYDMLDHFDASKFIGIVLDESSILKSFTGQMRTAIIELFDNTSYKLACTATPAPNDYMELGNHAEFVGVMRRVEMLSMFFVHDGGDTNKWRIKGHCTEIFWKWVASWAVMMSSPADLGYDGSKFILPDLKIHEIIVKNSEHFDMTKNKTLTERRDARRDSLENRVKACVDIVNSLNEPVLIWCDLNIESELLARSILNSHEITGSDSREFKESTMEGFSDGKVQKLVSKPSICGFGMNWQHCSKMLFVGLSDSFEAYYQAVRRCWRFGQKKPVDVWVITSEAEGEVVSNIKRKEHDFEEMLKGMISATQEITKENIRPTARADVSYSTDKQTGTNWTALMGDSCELIKGVESESIHYTIFSPPFSQLYVYSDSIRDLGNCKNDDEFMTHFMFLAKELYRVTKPGRLVSFHCMDLPSMKERDGVIGLKDFSGRLIDIFESVGFIYHTRVTIWKNPAVEVQRTKSIGLLHKQLKKDSSMSRVGIPDYLITMRKPGVNPEPITHTADEYSVNRWQQNASPVWMDINQSNTLQKKSARSEKDERHICPLQLDVIERCIELWTNKGDLVLDPFAGIGSTGYQAVIMKRRALCMELKQEYYNQTVANLNNAEGNIHIVKGNEYITLKQKLLTFDE